MVKAVVLCGGKGTRLRPYTYTIPKPMLPLGKRPILEYVLGSLKRAGITEIYLTVGYLHEQIEKYFRDGEWLGLKLHYSVETVELGTAGSIIPLMEKFNETFVVMMGDHLSNVEIDKIVEFHKTRDGIATIALNRKGVPLEYGVADMEGDRIVRFREKPIVENLVNAGVYVFEPEIFDYIKPKDDFASDVFPRLLAEKKRINGYVFSDYWLDIGRTTDYEHINQFISVIDLVKATDEKK
ncbi:MAG: nucleotidyltransferase family protein [Candidatus Micrarchaeota archaeon]|nr:nucleotidyltransferase family protein [Candidatus Micrarchaeota archaeon]